MNDWLIVVSLACLMVMIIKVADIHEVRFLHHVWPVGTVLWGALVTYAVVLIRPFIRWLLRKRPPRGPKGGK